MVLMALRVIQGHPESMELAVLMEQMVLTEQMEQMVLMA
jgi:hypothetical protein